MMKKSKEFYLDGWLDGYLVAALIVIAGFIISGVVLLYIETGNVGVSLFFGISGFWFILFFDFALRWACKYSIRRNE